VSIPILDNGQFEEVIEAGLNEEGFVDIQAVLKAYRQKMAEIAATFGALPAEIDRDFKAKGGHIELKVLVSRTPKNLALLESMDPSVTLLGNNSMILNEQARQRRDEKDGEALPGQEEMPLDDDSEKALDDDEGAAQAPETEETTSSAPSGNLFNSVEEGDEVELTDDLPVDDVTYPAEKHFRVSLKSTADQKVFLVELVDEKDSEDDFIGNGEPFAVSAELLNEVFTR